MYTNIIDSFNKEELTEFLEYKKSIPNFDRKEIEAILKYIEEDIYSTEKIKIEEGVFPQEYPVKRIISKEGSRKKRVVYSYTDDVNITLKFIAYKLHCFDYMFFDNCYSFRKKYGAINAIGKIKKIPDLGKKYCLKTDISNYFNSMEVGILIDKLEEFKQKDKYLYKVFYNILSEDRVYFNEAVIREEHGGMAGIPISPFFANIYMTDIDEYFYHMDVQYYRYSDDILIFASSKEELIKLKEELYGRIYDLKLNINTSKEKILMPGEVWEFLGFSYKNGKIDLSDNTIEKMKKKIKRKAAALRRWQKRKGLPEDKAVIGFINTINRKLYGKGNELSMEKNVDFNWSRWFFPNITTTDGLKIIDRYMQEYIRYTVTGRHYKGNYRIKYSKLKKWGYRNLVNEYYKWKKNSEAADKVK